MTLQSVEKLRRVNPCLTWILTRLLCLAVAGCGRTVVPQGRDNSGNSPIRKPAPIDGNEFAGAQQTAGGDQEPELTGNARVSIDNFTFHPETLEIPAGTKVVWINADDVPHTVRS